MDKNGSELEVVHGRRVYRLTTSFLRGAREVRHLALRADPLRDDRFAGAAQALAKTRPVRKPWQDELLRLGAFLATKEHLVDDLAALFGSEEQALTVLGEAWRRVVAPQAAPSATQDAFLHALGLYDELPVALSLLRLARLEPRGEMPMVMSHSARHAWVTKETGSGSVRVGHEVWETSVLWQTGRRMPVGLFVIENESDEEAASHPTTAKAHPLDQFFYWDHRWRELGLPRSCPMIWITPPSGLTVETLEPCARFRFSFTVPQDFADQLPSDDPPQKAVREVTVTAGGRVRKFRSHRAPSGRILTNCVRNTSDALALDKMRRKTEVILDSAFARSGAPADASRPWLGTQTDAMLRGRLALGFLTLLLEEAFAETLRRIEREGTAEASSLRSAVCLAAAADLSDADQALALSALASVFEVLAPETKSGKGEQAATTREVSGKSSEEKPQETPKTAEIAEPGGNETARTEGGTQVATPSTPPVERISPKKSEPSLFDDLQLFPEPPEAHPSTREWRRTVRPKNASLQGVLFTFED